MAAAGMHFDCRQFGCRSFFRFVGLHVRFVAQAQPESKPLFAKCNDRVMRPRSLVRGVRRAIALHFWVRTRPIPLRRGVWRDALFLFPTSMGFD